MLLKHFTTATPTSGMPTRPSPRPPFSKSDHDSLLLIPSYRQKLKQEAPVPRSIQCWSDQSQSMLQDCFDHADWDMFRVASENNIVVYTDTVTEFLRKCIADVVPTVTIKTYPNKKLWIDCSICTKLKVRTTTFNHGKVSGNMFEYKQCSYSLSKAIKQAKLQHSTETKWSRNSTARK
jgi:hypothetical protein